MKKLRIAGAIAALLLTVAVLSVLLSDRTAGSPQQITLAADCVKVLGPEAADESVSVEMFDRTSKPSLANLQKLAKPACRSLVGAREVAKQEGKDTFWMNNMPFVLVDKLGASRDQAQFSYELLPAEFSQSIHIAVGMFSSYLDDELVWVLGHELAHGVYEDSLQTKRIKAGGFLVAILTFFVAIAATKRPLLCKLAAAAAGVIVLATALIVAHRGPVQELNADVFGVKVLVQSGKTLNDAKNIVVKIFDQHPSEPEPFLAKYGIVPEGHPQSKVRSNNVQALR